MSRHLTRRACGKGSGFTWTRFPTGDQSAVTYRLHLRDRGGRLHASMLNFFDTHPRGYIAERIKRARNELRLKVQAANDDIELAALFEQENAA